MSNDFHSLVVNFKKNPQWERHEVVAKSAVTCLEWSPLGTYYAAGTLQGDVHLQCPSSSLSIPVSVGQNKVTSASFNQTSDLFACTSHEDNNIHIYNFDHSTSVLDDLEEIRCDELPRFVDFMQDVVSGQNLLLVGSASGLQMIDMDSGAVFRKFQTRGAASSIRSWNGCMMAVGTSQKLVQLWDARVRTPVAEYKPSIATGPLCFDVDRSARILALSGDGGVVHLYDISSKREIAKRKLHSNPLKAIRFSSQMRFLLSSDGVKSAITLLNDPLHSITEEINDLGGVTIIRWDPNECRVLCKAGSKISELQHHAAERL